MSEKEVIIMLKERLGYDFRKEELPPALRAGIRKLSGMLESLEGMRSTIYHMRNEIEYDEKSERERINSEYSERIRALEMDWPNTKVGDFIIRFIGILISGTFAVAFLIALIIYIIIYLWSTTSGMTMAEVAQKIFVRGEDYFFTNLTCSFITALFLSSILTYRKISSVRRKRLSIKKRIDELKNEWSQAISNFEISYGKLREKRLGLLKAKESELHSLESKFKTDLYQLASEIDTALNIIFQAKMDYGLLQTILKNRGLIIDKVACPHCGGNIKLPEGGHVTKCPYCLRDVYAVDVFREILKYKRS